MPQSAVRGAMWAGDRYVEQAGHHRQFDDWFVDRHPPRPSDHVVDAGCGSGEFTAHLARLVPDGRVVGVEPDPSMLEVARTHKADNLQVRQGRLQELDRLVAAASVDLVVSRAVFHWIPLADYGRCYEAILQILRPGGWFHAESAGAGNVRGVVELLDDIASELDLGPATVTFPDAGVAFDLLEESGLEIPRSGVTTVAQRRPFNQDQLLGFVRTQASLAYVAGVTDAVREQFLLRAEERIDELGRHDGSHDQTFVRLDVLCRRPV
ncbi:MAG TPA: methyltransferase domain-containing protein [Nitriliruptorales bacterium]|nr:methyltransferase domain-containing protein [Nitriliruptorales bacterium]